MYYLIREFENHPTRIEDGPFNTITEAENCIQDIKKMINVKHYFEKAPGTLGILKSENLVIPKLEQEMIDHKHVNGELATGAYYIAYDPVLKTHYAEFDKLMDGAGCDASDWMFDPAISTHW